MLTFSIKPSQQLIKRRNKLVIQLSSNQTIVKLSNQIQKALFALKIHHKSSNQLKCSLSLISKLHHQLNANLDQISSFSSLSNQNELEITNEWEQKILSYRQYYEEDEQQFGVDERKRVGCVKSADSLFGTEGSFNQFRCE